HVTYEMAREAYRTNERIPGMRAGSIDPRDTALRYPIVALPALSITAARWYCHVGEGRIAGRLVTTT
ncbi:MAG: hypothetical protein PHQ28_09420, partial [Mycobacterium sp.]|nr:hypothetical protein [Mycobacterium sp.]